jgi:predicted amino acid dehydrogenase
MYDNSGTLRNAIIEEIPESFTGISEIEVTNAGSGYVSTPTVTITGDGTGAQATAKILNGRVVAVTITNRGINYSRAVATITGGDGYGASAIAILDARFGTLRTIYYDENAERQVINAKAGTINYATGRITIDSINIISTTSADNQIRIDIESEKGIIKSNRNTIITIDSSDPSAITTELVEI